MQRLLTGFTLVACLAAFLPHDARAADLPVKAPLAAPVVAPAFMWTGFYAGLNIGGSWGRQDTTLFSAAGATLATNSNHIDGIIGGGQIGYNWQVSQVVFGIEADFQGSGQKGDGSFTFTPVGFFAAAPATTTISYTDKLEWFGTVRGRVGYAFDRWLPYVTGGWAYGHGELNVTNTVGATTTSFSADKNYSGWTLGGGVEWAFDNHWSARAEYLYIDFGDGPATAASATLNLVSGRMTDNIVRGAINYRF
jgi:outer membrane immunogenic protein